jgi:hypothetical protein
LQVVGDDRRLLKTHQLSGASLRLFISQRGQMSITQNELDRFSLDENLPFLCLAAKSGGTGFCGCRLVVQNAGSPVL